MQLITIDMKNKTFSNAAVEGNSNSVQVFFDNTPEEWQSDELGVFALFSKGKKGEVFTVDKATMKCDVPNSMVAENAGFKVTAFAMNSDTESPYRYVMEPIWVEVSEGYECIVSSAPDKDNMDAICSLIQVLMGYDEAETERKLNEEERKLADIARGPQIEVNTASIAAHQDTLNEHNDRISVNEENISTLQGLVEENKGEETYDPESIKSQSGKAVAQAIAGIVNSAPETLDTLEELAKALGNDPNFATTIMTLLGKKVDRLEKPKDAVVYVETKAGNTTGIPYATRPTRYTIPQRVETGALLVKEIPTLLNEAVSKKYVDTQADKKVDKLAGKGLSSNDFTDEYKMLIDENNYKIGDLGDLTTGVTETLVGAISETYDFACENNYNMGMLSDLITVHNDTFVDAINEIYEDTHQKPITTIPTTLSSNKQYNFGEVTSLSLAFPTSAEDGDVVYLTFFSGDSETSLTIDTTNTCDIEVVPETNTGYEIFGKYNGLVWIVNYSEYIVSEG